MFKSTCHMFMLLSTHFSCRELYLLTFVNKTCNGNNRRRVSCISVRMRYIVIIKLRFKMVKSTCHMYMLLSTHFSCSIFAYVRQRDMLGLTKRRVLCKNVERVQC